MPSYMRNGVCVDGECLNLFERGGIASAFGTRVHGLTVIDIPSRGIPNTLFLTTCNTLYIKTNKEKTDVRYTQAKTWFTGF
ncbi:hypothetical protein J2755_000136 [Methanohalophilus levihalophilus]|nr:hypothetical protein [Methanohalophilus levihalophilus]